MKKLLFLTVLLSVESYAEFGTRGGGNARVCFTNEAAAKAARLRPLETSAYWSSIASVEVLDLYEAKLPRGEEGVSPKIMATKDGETAKEYVERVAKRFDLTFPTFARIIREGRDAFNQSQIIWSAEAFRKTDDIDPELQYENRLCSILGLAYQKEVNGKNKIFINQKLFMHPKHSLLSRHVTFLHEYIYDFARSSVEPHETSAPTREAVGLAIAVLPDNVRKDKAEEWGLSIGAISKALMASGITDYNDRARLDVLEALDIKKDFVKFQVLLANSNTSQALLGKIHEIVFVKGRYYKENGPLLGLEEGVCRKGEASEDKEIILGTCLAVTENENDEFTKDPLLKNELYLLGTEFYSFFKTQAPSLARETILPEIFKDVQERMSRLHIGESDIQKYQTLLGDHLIKNLWIPYDGSNYFDLTNKISQNFAKYYTSDVIESINKRTAEAPSK